ncbi:MAG: NirD/YgiW/YdeI family stress tolerance protein [Alphaproteobacteria bacterium]
MSKALTAAAALTAVLLSGTALANNEYVKELPDKSILTVTGTVDSVDNEREFTLRDSTGTIGVDIESNQSVVLKKGDTVTISGSVDKDITGTDINATDVYVHKGFTQSVSDTLKSIPGVSTTNASAYYIKDLPKEGVVKLTGMVADVDNEKEFTLRDDTGEINVDVESAANAALAKGAKVTVIGTVDSDLAGKDINAVEVIVVADAKAEKNK